MRSRPGHAPPGPPDWQVPAGPVRRVRRMLAAVDYSVDGLRDAGVEVGLGVRHPDVAFLRHAVGGAPARAALIRLFVLGEEVAAAELERHVGRDADALLQAGLASLSRGRFVPRAAITPWNDSLVAHDPDPAGDLWADHVTGPNPAAEALDAITVPLAASSALDLGTGSGLLALRLAGRAGRVVATDVNRRALRYTAVNAILNDAGNVETRLGSLLEPVAGESFDLVVSNPPFVISPETELVFRHSRLPRDEISRTVLQGIAGRLAAGGVGHVLCNWVQRPGGSWREAIEPWLAGTGCDALVLATDVEDPLTYAARWNLRLQQVAPERLGPTIDAWLAYYRREGIEAIGSGFVVLRRRAGANWVRGLELEGETRGHAGDHVLDLLAAHGFLAETPAVDDLLATPFRPAAAHRLEQTLTSRDDGYALEPARLVREAGLGVVGIVEPDLLPVLLRMDGSQPLAAVVDEVAADGGGDRAAVADRAIGLVRQLLERGLVVPAGSPPEPPLDARAALPLVTPGRPPS